MIDALYHPLPTEVIVGFVHPPPANAAATPLKSKLAHPLGLFVTDIAVSYDGDGHPAFYKDSGAPVIVDLQVRFKERAILTSEDYSTYPSQNNFT